MIKTNLSFSLPLPWENQSFETDQIGPINFLVGPNGSGKSQFAHDLCNRLRNLAGGVHLVRLLGTDRLKGMEQSGTIGRDRSEGFRKRDFGSLKEAGVLGSGIDTIVILEERMDLRIQIQATLSHLFDREVSLEWNSGFLIPTASRSGTGRSYRLDHQECHGIKELLVLLTHLYDDQRHYLIIDEPELNLHPQYQAFFMHEVRKIAGDPSTDSKKKVIFLITHSPFILDLRTSEDLNSIISFDLNYSVPTQIAKLNLNISSSDSFIRRLNAHHKQLFFSDNPVFVEGIHDAWLIEAMMEARGISVAGAGSCIIDAGGVEEVNQYLELCLGLGKQAHFLYDLDSLFRGNLRACIKNDKSIQSFLLYAGVGDNFGKYFGELEGRLTCLVDRLHNVSLPPSLTQLEEFLTDLFDSNEPKHKFLPQARMAVMTAISRHREDILPTVSESMVKDIEGRRDKILNALNEKNIHVLAGGTIERYLPRYSGNEYKHSSDAKQNAIRNELAELSNLSSEEELSNRYGQLYDVVCNLPSKPEVDVEPVLRNHLIRYIIEFQIMVTDNPSWQQDRIQARLNEVLPPTVGVFSIQNFIRHEDKKFSATIEIMEMLGQGRRIVRINNETNAGMGDFQIESAPRISEGTE